MVNFKKIQPSKSMAIFQKVKELKQQGRDIISFSVGDTHFQPSPSILSNIHTPADSYSHYTISKGIPELRVEIAERYNTDAEDIVITNGVKQGIFYALTSLEGSTVCILDPAWLGYKETATICGKESLSISLHGDWLSQLEDTSFDSLILCSPNNPDGKVFTEQEVKQIIKICNTKGAYIIFDNIYKRFDYSGKYSKSEELILSYERSIITGGFSKSHAVTGFRIGYTICKDYRITDRINLLHQNIATCAPSISQYALLGLDNHDPAVEEYIKYYKENKILVSDIIPDLQKYSPDGGFYYFLDVSDFGFDDGQTFCREALDKKGIAMVPGDAYGDYKTYVRLSFSVDRDLLTRGLTELKEFMYE